MALFKSDKYYGGLYQKDGKTFLDLKTINKNKDEMIKQFYNHMVVNRLIEWDRDLTSTNDMESALKQNGFELTVVTKKDVPNIDELITTKYD